MRELIPFRNIFIFSSVSLVLAGLALAVKPILGGGLIWFLSAGIVFTILYFLLAQIWVNRQRRQRLLDPRQSGRVLLFSQHLGIGGLERMVLSLGQTLQQDPRWKVFVFSHDSDENADSYSNRSLVGDFIQSGIEVDALKKANGFSFKTLFKLIKNVYHNQIDVVHSHDMGTLVYAAIAKLLSLGRFNLVHTQHSFVHINRNKRYAIYERIFTLFVDQLTVVNDSLLAPYAALGVSTDRIAVISNAASFVSEPALTRADKLKLRADVLSQLSDRGNPSTLSSVSADFWILYLARLHSVKGQRDAAKLWNSLTPELRQRSALFLVGPEAETGEKQKVLDAFEGVLDRDRVIFVDGTRVPHDWIAASDVFLSCSKFEGMPIGPLEAIGSGLPAVLSSITGHQFLNQMSHQFPLDQPESGAAQIQNVLTDPEFGTQGYYETLWTRAQSIRQNYSLNSMTTLYAKFYAGERL